MNESRKIAEAEHFLHQMKEQESDYEAFVFNLSAFLSASRSVLQYVFEEAKNKPGGQSWYASRIASSAILRFFKEKRDFNIHVAPISLSQTILLTDQDTFSSSNLSRLIRADQDGNIIEEIPDQKDEHYSPPSASTISVKFLYTFPDWPGHENVWILANTYLNEVKSLVQFGIANGYLSAP